METRVDVDNEKMVQLLQSGTGREQGFRMLMHHYGRTLYWHIRRIVISHDDAEDALQETSIKVYNRIGQLRDATLLRSWLFRIATNEALQVLRQHTRLWQRIDDLNTPLAEMLQSEASPDATAIDLLFQKALLTLPTQQRIVFNMRYYDELSYEEMAHATGKSTGTLKANYHYAYTKIKKYMEENA